MSQLDTGYASYATRSTSLHFCNKHPPSALRLIVVFVTLSRVLLPTGASSIVDYTRDDGSASPFPVIRCHNVFVLPGVPDLLKSKWKVRHCTITSSLHPRMLQHCSHSNNLFSIDDALRPGLRSRLTPQAKKGYKHTSSKALLVSLQSA